MTFPPSTLEQLSREKLHGNAWVTSEGAEVQFDLAPSYSTVAKDLNFLTILVLKKFWSFLSVVPPPPHTHKKQRKEKKTELFSL